MVVVVMAFLFGRAGYVRHDQFGTFSVPFGIHSFFPFQLLLMVVLVTVRGGGCFETGLRTGRFVEVFPRLSVVSV